MYLLIASDPDTRLFEVREAFKSTLLLRFRAYIRAYITIFPGGPSRGVCVPAACNTPCVAFCAARNIARTTIYIPESDLKIDGETNKPKSSVNPLVNIFTAITSTRPFLIPL